MRYWLILIPGLLLAACSGPTLTPTTAPLSTATTPGALISGALTVKIFSPEDEAVVHTPQVEVVGEAPPDTVITLNDEIVVVGETGRFTVTLPLEEGPNEIEVVASDAEGAEVSSELTVTYEPQS